ncbi:glutathione S-transferase [Aestuariibius sp. HNIBRBA575]|uniref:glutathione S-transferase n=1 Tax=Aestuariibius sp. HNIBRBA575 TaxID=3233343 RepID=UPI0034A3A345
MTQPILYSFRRCPYAMRARLAIASAQVSVELREIVLRDKPDAFLAVSPSGTVPSLAAQPENIDESFDIMRWALNQNDPENLLDMPASGLDLITQADGPFKDALDYTKYASRHPDKDSETERATAMAFLAQLNDQLDGQDYLFGTAPRLADLAILPFVRQFAMIDKARFDAEAGPHLSRWLEAFLASDRLASIMQKYPAWKEGDEITLFPA